VLLYHAVCRRRERAGVGSPCLVVEPDEFELQMADLARRRFRTLSLDDFARALAGARAPGRSVLLTFDDAYAHLDEVVTPTLRRHGFTAAVFASWDTLGKPNTWDAGTAVEGLKVAGPGQLRSMRQGPYELGSHGLRHADLRELGRAALPAELARSRELLADLVGHAVLDLAYPYGHQDARIRRAARRAGYRMAFTVNGGDGSDAFQVPRQMVKGQDGRLGFAVASRPRLNPWIGILRETAPKPVKGALRAAIRGLRRPRGRLFRNHGRVSI
jgi:peptidoglycan/xylan/chitin deacetylase (PgdA/CDA1 family)